VKTQANDSGRAARRGHSTHNLPSS